MSRLRKWGSILWEAIKAYFVPLGILGAVLKLSEKLPRWAIVLLVLGLVGYIVYAVWHRITVDKKREGQLAAYESLLRLSRVRPGSVDLAFNYHTVRKRLFIAPPDAQLEAIEDGTNVSGRSQSEVVRTIVGDSPIDFAQADFRAWFDVGQGDKPASVSHQIHEAGREFSVRIGFRGVAVAPNGKVRIRWVYRWPGCVARNEDYWVFGLQHFGHPVTRLIVDCHFPVVPADHGLSGRRETGDEPVNMAGPATVQEPIGRNWHCYSADLPSPAGAYVLTWRMR